MRVQYPELRARRADRIYKSIRSPSVQYDFLRLFSIIISFATERSLPSFHPRLVRISQHQLGCHRHPLPALLHGHLLPNQPPHSHKIHVSSWLLSNPLDKQVSNFGTDAHECRLWWSHSSAMYIMNSSLVSSRPSPSRTSVSGRKVYENCKL